MGHSTESTSSLAVCNALHLLQRTVGSRDQVGHNLMGLLVRAAVSIIANQCIITSDIGLEVRLLPFGPPIAVDIDIGCYLIISGPNIERVPFLVIVTSLGEHK